MGTHHHYCHGSTTFLGHPPPPPPPWRPPLLHSKPFHHSRISCSNNNFPRWDSNAETFRPRSFSFNNVTGKKKPQQQEEEEDDEEEEYGKKRRWWSDESPVTEEEYSGIWEEAIDTMWIFKVFKSYGWTLPIIIASWLLATGPKTFLMALAIPLGQSALALAFEKLWGRSESKPKRKYRMRRKRSTVNDTRFEEEQEENRKTYKGKTSGHESWVVENNGSVDKGSREASSGFGGWDDLERARPATRSSKAKSGSQRMPMEAGEKKPSSYFMEVVCPSAQNVIEPDDEFQVHQHQQIYILYQKNEFYTSPFWWPLVLF